VRWSAPPVLRRLLTRAVALVPGMVVAAVQGPRGVDALLVASQVVLAGCLPFVCLPLLLLTSSKEVMSVRDGKADGEVVSFANGYVAQAFGWVCLAVLVVANVYVLVQIGRGAT
jgi:metal iron transporter